MSTPSDAALDLTSPPGLSRDESASAARIPESVNLTNDPFWTSEGVRRATMGFLILGILLRLVRYLMNFPLWGDEAFLAVNFIDRGYLELTQPLSYHQICPLFFLWVERAVVSVFGFSEWSLRLFPTLCSIVSVPVFFHVSGRLMGGLPRMTAVAIFAVSMAPIRHGGEVKPYATDLLLALVMVALTVEWLRETDRSRWLWALAAVVPLALGMSYPAVFVAGGIGLGLSCRAWQTRRWPIRVAFLGYAVSMVASFATLFVCFTRAQLGSVQRGLSNYWAGAFPPMTEPRRLLVWIFETHTGQLFAYPVGGDRGASLVTTICFVAGCCLLWMRGRRTLLATLTAPFGLALLASGLGLYPYGGSTRVVLYLAPTICLLAGVGAAELAAALPVPIYRRRTLFWGLASIATMGLILLGADIALPYKSIHDVQSREFARWFWTTQAKDAELVCVKNDLGTIFEDKHWQLFRTALYQSLQKIYSPRHRAGQSADLARISEKRPLRCVLYNESPEENPAIAKWFAEMTTRYNLVGSETYFVNKGVGTKETGFEDRYLVLTFTPRLSEPGVARSSDVKTLGR
jgi:hypothetical protein